MATASDLQVSIIIPCYRDAVRVVTLVRILLAQDISKGHAFSIIIVDDGSNDDSSEQLSSLVCERVDVQFLPTNVGRARARNHGARYAQADFLMFLDADCQPSSTTLLADHLRVHGPGVAASTGDVRGVGEGFWDRYQRDASRRRRQQAASDATYAGSSQNMMVLRTAFLACGGFDEAYHAYGFEDRDLLLRLGKLGRIAWAMGEGVMHLDEISMGSVSRKMREAALLSAPLFARDHAKPYERLGYSRIDARLHPWLMPIGRMLNHRIQRWANWVDRLIALPYVPYAIKRFVVKATTALSFTCGSSVKV